MNKFTFDLKQNHNRTIQSLSEKIEEQQKEIESLKFQIELLTMDREYDC